MSHDVEMRESRSFDTTLGESTGLEKNHFGGHDTGRHIFKFFSHLNMVTV
jgi:hypothetical protein